MESAYGTVYSVAGYSRGPDGKVKFRVANAMNRAGVLVRNGHTSVALIRLPIAMTKTAAQQYVDSKGTRQDMESFTACVDRMTTGQAARVRAEFNERVRVAYEAN